MIFHDLLRNGKPNTRAFVLCSAMQAGKNIKNPVCILRFKSNSVIADLQ
jgi:hypothetical protein